MASTSLLGVLAATGLVPLLVGVVAAFLVGGVVAVEARHHGRTRWVFRSAFLGGVTLLCFVVAYGLSGPPTEAYVALRGGPPRVYSPLEVLLLDALLQVVAGTVLAALSLGAYGVITAVRG